MDEKILIQSEHYSLKKFMCIFFAVTLLASVIICCVMLDYPKTEYEFPVDKSCPHYYNQFGNISTKYFYSVHPTFASYASCYLKHHSSYILIIALPLALNLLTLLLWFYMKSCVLTVTNKRIYGKTGFGKQVELPVDSISSVTTSAFKGISIATSSEKIYFPLTKNRDEIHKSLKDLIVARQSKL